MRRPGETGDPDAPVLHEFSRRADREASLGTRATGAALLLGRAVAEKMSGHAARNGVPVLGAGMIAGFLAAVRPKMALFEDAALAAAVPEPWPMSVGNR